MPDLLPTGGRSGVWEKMWDEGRVKTVPNAIDAPAFAYDEKIRGADAAQPEHPLRMLS